MTQEGIRKVVKSRRFNKAVSLAIIFCSLVLGIETVLTDDVYLRYFKVIDISITLFFVVEIILRLLSEDKVYHYFKLADVQLKKGGKLKVNYIEQGVWNWFDFVVVAISTIAIFTHFFEHSEYLLIARMFRIFRIFRLLEISTNLRQIEKKIVNVIPTVFTFALLLLILIYIYAIIGFYLFNGQKLGVADFSNLLNSGITLFQVMTLDGWGELMSDSLKSNFIPHFIVYIYYISFVILTAIISLNVFIAVLASSIEDRMNKDLLDTRKSITELVKKEADQTDEEIDEATELIIKEIKSLRSELGQLKSDINNKKE